MFINYFITAIRNFLKNKIFSTIKWNNTDNYTVRGVIKNPKYNSHIKFDLLASYSSLYQHEVLKNPVDALRYE